MTQQVVRQHSPGLSQDIPPVIGVHQRLHRVYRHRHARFQTEQRPRARIHVHAAVAQVRVHETQVGDRDRSLQPFPLHLQDLFVLANGRHVRIDPTATGDAPRIVDQWRDLRLDDEFLPVLAILDEFRSDLLAAQDGRLEPLELFRIRIRPGTQRGQRPPQHFARLIAAHFRETAVDPLDFPEQIEQQNAVAGPSRHFREARDHELFALQA